MYNGIIKMFIAFNLNHLFGVKAVINCNVCIKWIEFAIWYSDWKKNVCVASIYNSFYNPSVVIYSRF